MHRKENVRHANQATVRLTGDRGNHTLDVRDVVDVRGVHLHPHRWRGSLGETQEIQSASKRGRRRVEHDSDTRESGRDLLEHLKPLTRYWGLENAEPGNVAAGLRGAVDQAVAERIGYSYEYNRNGTRFVQHGGDRGGANGQDRVGLESDQFSRRYSHTVDFASRPAIRDPNVEARQSELLEFLP